MAFKALGLSEKIVKAIIESGYTAPTEIQSLAIPAAMEGKDIIGIAQTGTGKTAAFILPILNRLIASDGAAKHHPRALVLTPTRELALQVDEFAHNYGKFTNIRSLAVYGGVDMKKQVRALKKGVDIVVATPGRLLDHIHSKNINFSKIEVLVVDEADRMFDMGFIDDVNTIIRLVPKERQTFLFSATFSEDVQYLTEGIQINPEKIEVGRQQTPVETVTQVVYPVPQEKKLDLLLHLLEKEKLDRVLVFSRTKHGADKIARRLEKSGIKAIAIHSNRTQSQREKALAGFKNDEFNVLVATDVAARGIDVEAISHVINFDVPRFAEDYIHRIGRTGRATLTGDAFTFVSGEEEKFMSRIEKFIEMKVERKRCPGFNYKQAQKSVQKEGQPPKHRQKSVYGQKRTKSEKHAEAPKHTPKQKPVEVEQIKQVVEEELDEKQPLVNTNPKFSQPVDRPLSLVEYGQKKNQEKRFRVPFWKRKSDKSQHSNDNNRHNKHRSEQNDQRHQKSGDSNEFGRDNRRRGRRWYQKRRKF
jgi:ATP-dependent RNA helicase RhlE